MHYIWSTQFDTSEVSFCEISYGIELSVDWNISCFVDITMCITHGCSHSSVPTRSLTSFGNMVQTLMQFQNSVSLKLSNEGSWFLQEWTDFTTIYCGNYKAVDWKLLCFFLFQTQVSTILSVLKIEAEYPRHMRPHECISHVWSLLIDWLLDWLKKNWHAFGASRPSIICHLWLLAQGSPRVVQRWSHKAGFECTYIQ